MSKVLSLTESTYWLYAWGEDNEFVKHAEKGSSNLSLTGLSGDDDSETTEGLEFEVEVVAGLTLSWNVSEDDSAVSVKVKGWG